MLFRLLLLAIALPNAFAHPSHLDKRYFDDHYDHPTLRRRESPHTNWYQARAHPVHNLFRRQANDTVRPGTPEWQARYPRGPPDSNVPTPWIEALQAAERANLIPHLPVPINLGGPNYGGANPAGPEICSTTFQCRDPDDIWDAPDGLIGLSMDDGPVGFPGTSATLYDYLESNRQHVTHFMIGENIFNNPDLFLRAFNDLDDDIAVHTWTHPYMTTHSNLRIVAELGWTLQIIHDLTGGRVPRYWRPPYGDADNRVRAIAREVFGLTTVIWNRDTSDWGMGTNGITIESIQQTFQTWLTGPTSPGLMVLEHEIAVGEVQVFMNALPLIRSFPQWTATSVAACFNDSWYLNSMNNKAAVVPMDVAGDVPDEAVVRNGGRTATSTSTARSVGPTQTLTRGLDDNQLAKSNAIRTVAQTQARVGFLVGSFVIALISFL